MSNDVITLPPWRTPISLKCPKVTPNFKFTGKKIGKIMKGMKCSNTWQQHTSKKNCLYTLLPLIQVHALIYVVFFKVHALKRILICRLLAFRKIDVLRT